MQKGLTGTWKSLWVMLLLLPSVFLICLCFGGHFIKPLELLGTDSKIVSLRFYRLMTGFVVGGALAVSGVAYQAVLRNPLAEPFILGISGGASLGAALAVASNLTALSYIFLPVLSFCGAVIVLGIVLLLAQGTGAEYTNNIMLSGVIVGTVCSSILMFVITIMGIETLHSVTWWMLGSLETWDSGFLRIVAVVVFIGSGILFFYGREANVMSLGEEMAYYLGLSPRQLALILLGIASVLTASAVALSGIIGFVGLIIPHLLRHIFGADHRRLFPLAMIGGGMFLMVCDTFARTVLYPQEIPVGVITAFMGGPFFLWLLNRKRKYQ